MHQPTQAQGTTNERAQGTTNAQTWEHKQQTNENLLASGWDSSDLGGFRQQQTQDNTQKQGLEFQTQTKRNLPGMKTKTKETNDLSDKLSNWTDDFKLNIVSLFRWLPFYSYFPFFLSQHENSHLFPIQRSHFGSSPPCLGFNWSQDQAITRTDEPPK